MESNQTKIKNQNGGSIPKLIIIVSIIAVLVIAIIGVAYYFTPRAAINRYLRALESSSGIKMASAIEIKGAIAYSKAYNFISGFDVEKFIEEYKKVDNRDVENNKEKIIETYDNKERKISIISINITENKETKEFDNCRGLYDIDCKIRIKYKDSDDNMRENTQTAKFYVYKHKVIYTNLAIIIDSIK